MWDAVLYEIGITDLEGYFARVRHREAPSASGLTHRMTMRDAVFIV
jgi:hypothetical protein